MNEYGQVEKGLQRKGLAVTFLASLLLGSQYVVIKVGLADLDPFLFSALAMSMGALVMIAFTLVRGTFTLRIFRTWEAWAAPLVSFVLVTCLYMGLDLTNASTGALLIGANVLIVAPLSVLIFHDRLGWMRSLGLAVGMLGLIVLTTNLDFSTLEGGQLLGDVLLLVATTCIALTYILSKFALRHMTFDQWVLTIHLFTPLPLFAMYFLFGSGSGADPSMVPMIVYAGVFCTALPTLMWVWGLPHIGMVASSTIILSESTFAVFLAVVLLDEPLTWEMLLGAALVFTAIYLVVRGASSAIAQKKV
ncbi:MAG: DMT family transporter [Methanomassiliicoccales archaeon]|jgi:drug/metabolite transporter (DMT)-like permease|nr:DMT family transporter [Methanomassiliicoccales archaeon]